MQAAPCTLEQHGSRQGGVQPWQQLRKHEASSLCTCWHARLRPASLATRPVLAPLVCSPLAPPVACAPCASGDPQVVGGRGGRKDARDVGPAVALNKQALNIGGRNCRFPTSGGQGRACRCASKVVNWLNAAPVAADCGKGWRWRCCWPAVEGATKGHTQQEGRCLRMPACCWRHAVGAHDHARTRAPPRAHLQPPPPPLTHTHLPTCCASSCGRRCTRPCVTACSPWP